MGKLGELGRFCLIILERVPVDPERYIDLCISLRVPRLTTLSSLLILNLLIHTHILTVHGRFQPSPFSTQISTFVDRFPLFNKHFIRIQPSS